MIRSTHLASVAIAALLALPAAALAQSAQTPAAGTVPPAAAAAASPMSSHAVPGNSAEQRVAEHIKQMHAQLQITSAEQPQWEQFANVMRENARNMDQALDQRMQQYPTMNALQNMQSYQQIAEAHAEDLGKLVPAFGNLYNAMPPQQQQLTDRIFRANAETNAQKRMQTGSNTAR